MQVTPFLYEQMIVSERLLFIELEFLIQDFGKKGDVWKDRRTDKRLSVAKVLKINGFHINAFEWLGVFNSEEVVLEILLEGLRKW